MADTKIVNINMTSSIELTSSLIEQLGKAFIDLEAHSVASTDNVQWSDVEGHFHNLELLMKKKLEGLEAKEKEITERESHNCMLLAEREAAVYAKEQDLLDRVQELKDAAVTAIGEARVNYIPDALEVASGGDTNGNQVSRCIDDENAPLDAQEGKTPSKMGEYAEGEAIDVNLLPELTQFCEQMDSNGLLKFVMKNYKTCPTVLKEQLSVALGSATEPAHLVLDALEGFFPPNETTQQGDNRDAALCGMRRSCLILLEALSAFLSKANSAVDNLLSPETEQRAKSIANEWKPKLAGESTVAANGNSLEAEGFLRLLSTFRIASEFDEEELCKYVLAVAHHRQATELCHSLELTQKIPGLVETLIKSGRQVDAVHFIHAFQLSEAFPPVPLLKGYLKELRRNSQGNGSTAKLNENNARELAALRDVIGCVEKYKLEADYPLDPLQRRVGQLDKSGKGEKKRIGEREAVKPPQPKKPRSNGGFSGSQARGSGGGRAVPPPFSGGRAAYSGLPERYTPAAPSAYTYPISSQSPYAAQASDHQRSYYYAQDDRARAPYSAVPPTYGTYMQSPHQPYM